LSVGTHVYLLLLPARLNTKPGTEEPPHVSVILSQRCLSHALLKRSATPAPAESQLDSGVVQSNANIQYPALDSAPNGIACNLGGSYLQPWAQLSPSLEVKTSAGGGGLVIWLPQTPGREVLLLLPPLVGMMLVA